MIDEIMAVLKQDGNDVDGVMQRFMNMKKMYQKYLLKYLDDPCFQDLTQALQDGNIEDAFRASHTLKGVASNLGLTNLYNADVVVVEKLRNGVTDGVNDDYKVIAQEHKKVIEWIRQYLSE